MVVVTKGLQRFKIISIEVSERGEGGRGGGGEEGNEEGGEGRIWVV